MSQSVSGCCRTYHFSDRELSSLSNDVSVDGHHGTTIIVDTVSITAPLVSIQIYTSALQHQQEAKSSNKFGTGSFVLFRLVAFSNCAYNTSCYGASLPTGVEQHCSLAVHIFNACV